MSDIVVKILRLQSSGAQTIRREDDVCDLIGLLIHRE